MCGQVCTKVSKSVSRDLQGETIERVSNLTSSSIKKSQSGRKGNSSSNKSSYISFRGETEASHNSIEEQSKLSLFNVSSTELINEFAPSTSRESLKSWTSHRIVNFTGNNNATGQLASTSNGGSSITFQENFQTESTYKKKFIMPKNRVGSGQETMGTFNSLRKQPTESSWRSPQESQPSEREDCPICTTNLSSDDMDTHLPLCISTLEIDEVIYNTDVLREDEGDCSICLEELRKNDVIARLPCLCIYHETCIKDWFKIKKFCPQHPSY